MHLVLVTICYPPEIRSISIMMRELAEELVARGHRVTVLTSWPQYNLSAEARGTIFATDMHMNGVRVIRVKTLPTHKVAYVLRGLAHLDLPRRFLWTYHAHVHDRVDGIISYISPLPLAQVGHAIAREHRAPHLLNVQDIFPQNAIDLGIMRNRALIAYFERMERIAYANADVITTHTEGSKTFLLEQKQVPTAKVSVVPNWIDLDTWRTAKPTGAFRRRYRLEKKIIIGFPGVLGPAQHLDFVLEVARRTQDLQDLVFLFVGDGTERERLVTRAQTEGLRNVQFETFVDPSAYPAFVKELDVGLLCLDPTYTTSMVPGKLTGFLAAGIPVLAFLNRNNDGLGIVSTAHCGYTCISDDVHRAVALVRQCYRDRQRLPALGAAGRAYAEAHYAKYTCIDALERMVMQCTATGTHA
ncbi:glycosyltransferase family 4 protein [Candidatus Uhrbacteria bacterium]|nr:glycosyltransferase family 4 protein [Candidatus Uhrbacteria bacterium]